MSLEALPLITPSEPGGGRHKFLKAEDDLLRSLVGKYGDMNWNLVSSFMSRRNARQCRERYKNYLSPIFRNTPWTEAEEALLTQKVREIGPKWAVIAKAFDGRSDVNVKNHWAAMASRNDRIERCTRAKAEGMVAEEFKIDPFGEEERGASHRSFMRTAWDLEDDEFFL
jgi:hypothetical protein